MKNKFLVLLLLGMLNFSFVIGEEINHTTHLQTAEQGFQERWQEFHKERTFHHWRPDWTEDELKSRFDQIVKERSNVYFSQVFEGKSNSYLQGQYRPAYEVPKNFASWGSRFSTPGTFSYNLASPDYNASIITLDGQPFLAMEAPTSKNVETFFSVLSQYHVTDLVRLTAAIENMEASCFPYWEGHLNINPKTGKSTIEFCNHEMNYYFTDSWKNHDGIEPNRLIALVKTIQSQQNPDRIIAVHCKAGVGRTGTFLAAYALIHKIDAQIASGIDIDHIQVSIDQVIWELSLQRPFMMARYSQYLSLYQLVSSYIESLKVSPPDSFPHYPGKSEFASLITPEKSLAYYQTHGQLPSCPPPKTIIFCYSKQLIQEVCQNYSMRQCDGKLGEIYFFEDYPGVAIVNFGWGAPCNAARLDLLLSWGVKQCISIGLAGGIQKDLMPGDIIVCDRAIRDEGLSQHYLPAGKYAYPSSKWTDTLCQTLDKMKIPFRKGASWTTDAFYRETRQEVQHYQNEGVLTSEMEAAALFAVASQHGAEIISFFTISDTLGDLEWKPDFNNSKTRAGLKTLVEIALKVPKENIQLVDYDPKWPQMFEKEAGPIQQALGNNCLAIHHFGSTSIPGLKAKPKLDILAVVHRLDSINIAALEKLGFESRGEVIPTGRYFCKDSPRVHLHVFEEGNPNIQRNLAFRDYLSTHDDDRAAYSELKSKLATEHHDGMEYCRAKTDFINQIIAKANQKR